MALSKQEVFNKVARHLILQNEQSIGGYKDPIKEQLTVGCAYRGRNGLKCAAGCIIPDELYSQDIEGTTFGAIWDSDSRYKELFDLETCILIGDLQLIHDNRSYGPALWPQKLEKLAKDNGLEYTVINEALKERGEIVQ